MTKPFAQRIAAMNDVIMDSKESKLGAAACAGWKAAGDPEDDDEDEEEEKKNRDDDEDGDDEDDEEEPWRFGEHGGR